MYTQDWNKEFKRNTAFLPPHSLNKVVEIGSFEGATSNYIVENLLSEEGTLTCIDPLDTNYSLDNDNELFQGQYDRFIENTKDNENKIQLLRVTSNEGFKALASEEFDFIYIDGHHTQNAVIEDGNNAFRVCKVGGYILFDDYLWGNDFAMKRGIDLWLSEHTDYKILTIYNQVLIQKLSVGSGVHDGRNEFQEKSVEVLFGWDKIHASYCNLDSRPDREEHAQAELKRSGLPFVRTRSFPWQELYETYDDEQKQKVGVMFRKTPGAIGCHYSQVAIMEEALKQGKHAFVNEDDFVFCDDIQERLKIIYKFLNQHEWDIFWMGGTWHNEPTWHRSVEEKHTHPDMQLCKCLLNRDWEPTLNPNIVRTYGAFSTHSYIVNKDRIQHILNTLDRDVSKSMGIDWIMLLEQPNLATYAFNTGCCKQYDNQSNIGDGISRFSGFANLGRHWFTDLMDKF